MQPTDHLALIMEQLPKTLLLRAKHCYTRKFVPPSKRCDFCKKTMFLLTLRCKDCRVTCHRRCARQAADLCELAESHKLATGHKNKTGGCCLPDCQSKLESAKKSVASTKVSQRKGSTDSFPEYEHRHVNFRARKFSTRHHLSLAPDTNILKDHSLCRMSRSTISSQSSNRSSVSGYYSLESDTSFVSDCETPKEFSVFDSSGAAELLSPLPCAQAPSCHRLVSDCSATVSPATGCWPEESCKSRTEANSRFPFDGVSLVATWPLGRKCNNCRQTSDNDNTSHNRSLDAAWSADYGGNSFCSRQDFRERREGLNEWKIPHKDLKYGRCIQPGRLGSMYKGRWHGDVLIQTRDSMSTNIDDFLDEVSMLSLIRHENIALFMGACVEPGNFAVVTSIHKGPSLYHHIHVQHKKLATSSKVDIARQIAQAMGYLHAKGIIIGHLSSRCVYLESKVKLSVTRVDTRDAMSYRPGYACLPRGRLSYLAPECLAASRVTPPELVNTADQTQQTDVYAFGTTLFEILAGRWPFHHACAESTIYQICTGKRDRFSEVTCASNLKNLVLDCWAHNPVSRPSFSEIVMELKKNVATGNMKHSLSEPDNLNRLGTGLTW